jgi:serine/threonine protein kinase
VAQEIKALRKLSYNEHIIGLEKVYFEGSNIYLVMQYAKDGSLFDYINATPTIGEKDVKKIIGQLLLALNFMHQNKLVHRDLKPANILVMDKKN